MLGGSRAIELNDVFINKRPRYSKVTRAPLTTSKYSNTFTLCSRKPVDPLAISTKDLDNIKKLILINNYYIKLSLSYSS